MSEWLLAGFPQSASDSPAVYAFDNGLASSAHDWVTAVGGTAEQADLEGLIQLKNRADNLEELLDVVGTFAEFSPSMHFDDCFVDATGVLCENMFRSGRQTLSR